MRKKRLPSALGIAVILALCLPFMFGCASTATPARKVFTTISDATAGATAAMDAFNDRYQAGLQTEADRTKALAYWADFQTAAHVAGLIAKDPARTADPVAVMSDAATRLIQLLAQLLPAKTGLLWFPEVVYG